MVEHKRLVSRVECQRKPLLSPHPGKERAKPVPNRADFGLLETLLTLFCLKALRSSSFIRKTAILKSRICLLLAVLLPLAVLSVTAHAANGDLRLCDTTVTNSCTVTTDIGRLEVEYNGMWKGVCDDYFTSHEARVACGQLNYPNSRYAKTLLRLDGPTRAHRHNGEFWLDDLLCGQGDNTVDNKLMDCARAGSGAGNEIEPGESGYWGEHNCKSNEYAGVVCVITAPAKPTNLEAEAKGQSMIVLNWRAPNSYVEGYKIEVSENGGNDWDDLESDTGNADTTYTHSGLPPSATRHYQVSAINSEGTSDPSNIASATTEGVPPPSDQPGTVALSFSQLEIGTALTATLTDPDGSIANVEWTWYRSADKSNWNPISGATSSGSATATYTPVADGDPNVEDDEDKYLRAVASYDDGHGPNKSAEAESASKVPAVNWAPSFDPDPPPSTFSVDENTGTGVNIGTPIGVTDPEGEPLTYSLDDGDGDSFAIDSSGQIKTKSALDYEVKSSYTVEVKVTDGTTEITTTVTINVTNVEEDGTVTLSSYSPNVGIELTAELEDPDDGVTGITWQWQRKSSGGTFTNIPGATSSGSATATYTPSTGDLNHLLRAKASYTDGHGSNTDMAYADSNEAVTDTCPPNHQNEAPEFKISPPTFSVAENTRSGVNVGTPVTAEDGDAGQQIRLTYSLDDGDGDSFSIENDNSPGQIKTKSALDYDTQDSYTVTVSVTDPCGEEDTIDVTINVTEPAPPSSNTRAPNSEVTKSAPAPTAKVPQAPANLTAGRGDGEVTLSWRVPNDGGSVIKYYEYMIDDGPWISTKGKSTTHTVAGLTNGETYKFKVHAVNVIGPGPGSRPVKATPATVPGPPRNLTVAPGDQRATLMWERPADNGGLPITSYEYVQKEGSGSFGSWISIDNSGPMETNETSYVVTGLKDGTVYSFKVRAVNAVGPGDASAEATAETSTSASRRLRRVSLSILPEFGRTLARNSLDALAWRLDSVLSGSFERTGMFRLMDQHAGLHDVIGIDIWDDPELSEELSLEELLYGSSFIIEAGGMPRKPKQYPTKQRPKEAPKKHAGEHSKELPEELRREYPQDEDMWIDEGGKPNLIERRGDMAFWGKADYSALSVGRSGENLSWDGGITSGYLGVDRRLTENVLTGISVALTKGDFDYTDSTPGEGGSGDYHVKMLSVSPYIAWLMSEDAYLWGAIGYGRGEIDIDDEEVQSVASGDLSYKSVAAGGSGRVFDLGDTTFSLKGEAFKVWMDVEGEDYLIDDSSVGVHQLRLGMEGSYEYRFASGAWFNPLVEVALRHDGGDGETGTGVEIGGGFLFEDPDMGLSIAGRGRWLAVHSSDEFSQWGVGGTVIFDTGADKEGALFSVAPGWGDTSSGIENLWERGAEGVSSEYGRDNSLHLDAEFGYGLPALGGDGILTPYSGLRMRADGWRQYRLGSRLDLGRSTSLSLETERRQSDAKKPEHGIMLRGKLNF